MLWVKSFIPSVIWLFDKYKYFKFLKLILASCIILLSDKSIFSKLFKLVFNSKKSIFSILLKLKSNSIKLGNLLFDKQVTFEILLWSKFNFF